jgi:CubicO group peptidase (beta-lactamase class C family)
VSWSPLSPTSTRFTRLLVDGRVDGEALLSAEHLQQMTSDQVPAENKTPDSFFPGFWDGMGWGFGVGVQTEGPLRGRYGWSGGQGTDFFVDRDGTVGILLTQVELGERTWPLLGEFQALHQPT